MKTINIRGNQYAMVHERVKEFRSNPAYKDYDLITELVFHDSEECIFRAKVLDGERIITTGTAYESKVINPAINKTSMFENCETSAVGRALAFLGIGIDGAIASQEEIKRVQDVKEIKKNVVTVPAELLEDISLRLDSCESIADLKNLHSTFASHIRKYPSLKNLFSKRKEVLNG